MQKKPESKGILYQWTQENTQKYKEIPFKTLYGSARKGPNEVKNNSVRQYNFSKLKESTKLSKFAA